MSRTLLAARSCNIRFFHLRASKRCRKNTISEITDNGRLLHNLDDIHQAFHSYYSTLFGSNSNTLVEALWEELYQEGRADLQLLEPDISRDEVKEAVFSMAKNKSPGPGGFLISFYQRYWEIVGPDIIQVIKAIQSHRTEVSRFYFSFITLIPKATDTPPIKDFRPIYLEHTIIKIF